METERASPRFSDIDRWEPGDILDALIESQMAAVAAVRAALPAIQQAAAAMQARLSGTGRLIYVGAGTSGRLAVQDGAELIPTFDWPPERLLLLMAGGKDALLRSAEGAEDQIDQAAWLILTTSNWRRGCHYRGSGERNDAVHGRLYARGKTARSLRHRHCQ